MRQTSIYPQKPERTIALSLAEQKQPDTCNCNRYYKRAPRHSDLRGFPAPDRIGDVGSPESGKELRSAHSTSGITLFSPEDSLKLREALSTMFFTSDRNIMVCTSFTSEYSGSQCMWALATSSSCLSMPWADFPAEERGPGGRGGAPVRTTVGHLSAACQPRRTDRQTLT